MITTWAALQVGAHLARIASDIALKVTLAR
jgi:hypothetical protein